MSDFTNRIGHDNFVWWIGVVEDRFDPLNLGRCRVRIFGSHTENLQEIPTADLPWAQTLLPVNSSLITGTAQEGDYVFGFFLDGLSCQAPCIFGIFPGIPQQFSNPETGFTDQRNANTLANSPRKTVISGGSLSEGNANRNPIIIGEPTNSRISRNHKVDETIIGYMKNTLDENVPIAGGATWSEPITKYAAKAPFDRVLETESGHVVEFDDTPGAERINIAHRKGSFVEFHPDGSKVTKIVSDNYEICLSDNNIHIKGDYNLTIDGGAKILVKGDANISAKSINLTADNTNITGDLIVTGNITSDSDVIASGISLKTHIHSGVKTGTDTTLEPQ
jgi:phage baseplate assembly protein gpV